MPEVSPYTVLSIQEAIGDLKRLIERPLDEDSLEAGLSQVFSCLARAWHVRKLSDAEFERLTDEQAGWLRNAIPNLAPYGFKVVADWTPVPDTL